MEQKKIEADLDIAAIIDLAIVILIVTVIIVFGGTFTEDMRSDLPSQTASGANATMAKEVELALNRSQTAFFKIPQKLGILVSAILFAIVIAIIVKYVWFANRGATGGI